MSKEIPFFKAPTQPLKQLGKKVDDILSSGVLIKGKYNQLFEEKLKEYLKVDNIILVSSGTIGLAYLLTLLNSKTVYMPSFTFGATATTASWAGIKDINFLDIDNCEWTVGKKSLDNTNIKNESLIVPVNLFGNACDFEYIDKIAKDTNSHVIYDSAHALGSTYKNEMVGSQGLAQVFSLSPTKVLTSAEGGIISTNNSELAEKLRWMVEWGHKGDYNTIIPGLNARMSEIHALIGYESLLIIDELLERRYHQVNLYKNNLNSNLFTYQKIHPETVSTYKDFAIIPNLIKSRQDRQDLINYLQDKGVNIKTYFDPPIHKHDFYSNLKNSDLENTNNLADKIICLPVFYNLPDEDIKFICKLLNEYFSKI